MRLITLAIVSAAMAWAGNVCSTTATGTNWSSASHWSSCGGSVPGNGDTAIIANNTTIDVNMTVGRSAPGTPYHSADAMSVTAAGGGSTGGSFPAGTGTFLYTCVDSNGVESGWSLEYQRTSIAAGNIPQVTFPALPSQCASRNLYAGTAGYGTETLYATGITATTYNLSSSSWNNGTQSQGSAPVPPAARGAAILVNSGVNLTFSSGVTTTIRGDLVIRSESSTVTMNPGVTIQFDGSQAVTASAAKYSWQWGVAPGSTDSNVLSVSCSSSSPCYIQSNTGGGNAWMTPAAYGSGTAGSYLAVQGSPQCLMSAAYLYIDNMGGSTADASLLCGTGRSVTNTISNVIWGQTGSTGPFLAGSGVAIADTENFAFSNSSFKNSSGTYSFQPTQASTSPTGTRSVSGIYFDQKTYMRPGWTYSSCIFYGGGWFNPGGPAYTVQNSFIRLAGNSLMTNGVSIPGTLSGNYVLADDGWTTTSPLTTGTATSATATTLTVTGAGWTTNQYYSAAVGTDYVVLTTGGTGANQERAIVSNTSTTLTIKPQWTVTPDSTTTFEIRQSSGHKHLVNAVSITGTTVITGNTFDYTGASPDAGAHCILVNFTSGTASVKNNLSVISPGMSGVCDVIVGASTTGVITMEHNTMNNSPGLMTGDYADVAGSVLSYRSNIFVSLPSPYAAVGYGNDQIHDTSIAANGTCNGTQDYVSPSNVDYNYGFNLSSTGNPCYSASGLGYWIKLSAAAGTHDVNQSGSVLPFVDPTRNFYTWAIRNGSTGTIIGIYSDAFAKMKTVNDFSGATTTYLPSNLLSWVPAGWAPTNVAMNFTYPGDTNAVTNVGAIQGAFGGIRHRVTQQQF